MLIFETHSTSLDNEAGLASGHNDVALSMVGLKQAEELGRRNADVPVVAIYCSDLQRSYKTAEIAFAGRDVPIVRDARLRECDYGDMTQVKAEEIKQARAQHVSSPFPNGESYEDTCRRVKSFLDDVSEKHKEDDVILVVGHRATQYGLEHCLKGVSVHAAVTAPWAWQPGWQYEIKGSRA